MNRVKEISNYNADLKNIRLINNVPEVVFICWFGIQISENRLHALNSLIKNINVPYILLTDENVYQYEKKDKPFHKSFPFLSGNHKSDYLRSYLLHYYGGGYHDVKYRNEGWIGQWDSFQDTNIWIKTRPERHPSWIGYDVDNPVTRKIQSKYKELGTMCWVICRPNTLYTKNLLNNIETRLDKHYENLKKNPSTKPGGYYANKPFSKVEDVNTMYPLRWLEIMGEHFHLLMYTYKDHMIFGLPDCQDISYK